MRRLGLPGRLVLAYMTVTTAALVLLGGSQLWGLARSALAQDVRLAATIARRTAWLASDPGNPVEHLSLDDPGMLAAARHPGVALEIFQGTAVAQKSANLGRANLPAAVPPRRVLTWGALPLYGVSGPLVRLPTGLAVEAVSPVIVRGRTVGHVAVAVSVQSLVTTIDAVGRSLLEVGGSILLLSSLVTAWVTFGMLRRLTRLTRATARIAGGRDLSRRLPEDPVGDEVSALQASVNQMLGRLEESFARQALVVAQASHQLRTPLATALGYSGLLTRWAREDPALVREGLEEIHRQLRRLQSTVDAVLRLAAVEGEEDFRPEPVPVAELCEAWRQMADVPVEVVPGPDVSVRVDRDLLFEARSILSAYTRRHGGSDARMILTWEAGPTDLTVRLEVSDTGPGFPPDLLPAAFDPFVKGPSSTGAGLGLSLVRTIVARHGGDALAFNRPEGGAVVVLVLPRDDSIRLS
ncbi:MAG: HAMP domain-containing histidine kinase [Actinomycetia bacterium]|nr:HAMP domain-containing histidine kinase [Actinomycetes bacterium]